MFECRTYVFCASSENLCPSDQVGVHLSYVLRVYVPTITIPCQQVPLTDFVSILPIGRTKNNGLRTRVTHLSNKVFINGVSGQHFLHAVVKASLLKRFFGGVLLLLTTRTGFQSNVCVANASGMYARSHRNTNHLAAMCVRVCVLARVRIIACAARFQ